MLTSNTNDKFVFTANRVGNLINISNNRKDGVAYTHYAGVYDLIYNVNTEANEQVFHFYRPFKGFLEFSLISYNISHFLFYNEASFLIL